MSNKRFRIGLLVAALAVTLESAAAPRYWALPELRYHGGAHASGYFSFDDATRTISDWNVQIGPFFQGTYFPGFTYVPGNSTASVIPASGAGAPTLVFSATMGVPGPSFWVRQLQLTSAGPLDGTNATVPIANAREDFPFVDPSLGSPWTTLSFVVTNDSLTLMPVPPQPAIVQVDEFYHPGLRHYFITATVAEKQALDAGVHSGWQRTGESFKAYARESNTASGSIHPVCRFYSPAEICSYYDYYGCEAGSDSHFLSADEGECLAVSRRYSPHLYREEFSNAFQIELPDKTSGSCPIGTTPVYRLWNQRKDSNHRYTTSAAIKAQMLGEGFLAEGHGPEGVVMCALQ